MCDAMGECLPCQITRLEKEKKLLVDFARGHFPCNCGYCDGLFPVERRLELDRLVNESP